MDISVGIGLSSENGSPPMRISRCTRCDQLIDYDAPYEGEEVLCPACDNITRLQEIPEAELPDIQGDEPLEEGADAFRKSRAPLRIQSADALPKPDADPVAPVKPSEDSSQRGDLRETAAKKEPDQEDSSKQSEESPPQPELRILSGTDAEQILLNLHRENPKASDLLTAEGLRLQIPSPKKAFIILALLLFSAGALLYCFRPTEAKRRKAEQEDQDRRVAQIEHGSTIGAPTPRIQMQMPESDQPMGSGFAFGSGREDPAPGTARGMVSVGGAAGDQSATPTVVEIQFATPPSSTKPNTSRAGDEAYRFFARLALEFRYRLFDNTVIDLHPLSQAINAGVTEFYDNWRLLGGTVARQTDEGLYLRLDERYFGRRRLVFVNHFPRVNGLAAGDNLGVLAKLAGIHNYKPENGAEERIENYEFGNLPSDRMIDLVKDEAKKREARIKHAMLQQAKKEEEKKSQQEAQKKRERDARVIAFLRKRVETGSASAQYSLGLRYLEGDGVPQDRNEGVRLLKESAKQGYVRAKKKIKDEKL